MTQWDTVLVDGTVETVNAHYMHIRDGVLDFLRAPGDPLHSAETVKAFAPGAWLTVTRLPPVPA